MEIGTRKEQASFSISPSTMRALGCVSMHFAVSGSEEVCFTQLRAHSLVPCEVRNQIGLTECKSDEVITPFKDPFMTLDLRS